MWRIARIQIDDGHLVAVGGGALDDGLADPRTATGDQGDFRGSTRRFIEEMPRLESPVKGDFRLARRSITIGGVEIPAGTTVMVMNGAANRDPRQFEDPDTFDVARSNARRHIAFGRGVHTCPGAPLARAEARVSIERLLGRTSEITISEEHHGPADARRFNYVPTFILRGLMELNLDVAPSEGRD
jgi:cytochrome P450